MVKFRATIEHYFGQDALEWFDRAYLTDCCGLTAQHRIMVAGIWVLSQIVSWSPVFERGFDPADPVISFSHKKNQVGSATNHFIALFGPLAVFIVVGMLQRSLLTIHHAALGLCAARGLARLITGVIKHSVGRLRPDFMARCKWDRVLEACTGKAQNITDGRKSFPSGHSSTAFSGMVFLSLWIAGQTAAWCFGVPKSPRNFRSSRMAIFCLTLVPLFWALRVAISRIQDHRHHKEDVIVGSFIGIMSALICYLIFWPSPFSASTFDFQVYGQPRLLYNQDGYRQSRAADFELGPTIFDNEERESAV